MTIRYTNNRISNIPDESDPEILSYEIYSTESDSELLEGIKHTEENLTLGLFLEIKDTLKMDISSLLGPPNFEGEAIAYLTEKQFPITKQSVEQYSTAIYSDFIANIDNLLVFNEDDKLIHISPYVTALEYGDYYRPGIAYITKKIESLIKSMDDFTSKNSI